MSRSHQPWGQSDDGDARTRPAQAGARARGTERAGPRPRCGCTGIGLGVVGSNGCAARMGGSVGGGIARRTSRIPRGYSLR